MFCEIHVFVRYMFLISPRSLLPLLIIWLTKTSVHFGPVPDSNSYEFSTKTRGTDTLELLHWNLQQDSSHDILHISEAHYAAVIFGPGKEYTRVAGV
jgi:hypothetical protein